MTTHEKLENYRAALVDWQWRVKAMKSNPLSGNSWKLPEPTMDSFGLSSDTERWAAAKVRAQILKPKEPSGG